MEHILSNRLLATKRGTITLGIAAALLAGLIVLVYLNRYRASLNDAREPVTVLVAERLIEKGTPGNFIGGSRLFESTTIPKGELVQGAISDPGLLRGQVAVTDIYPGQQLAVTDFAPAAAAGVTQHLALDKRAIAIPVDAAHGNLGHLRSGDHVDVFAGFNVEGFAGGSSKPVLKLLMTDALVLAAPGDAATGRVGGSRGTNVVLRANYQQAAELAFAADNGRLWLILRPTANSKPTPPELVTAETILFGIKPVAASARIRSLLAGRVGDRR